MQDIDKPRFKLELSLSGTGMRTDVDDPTLIQEEVIGQAWTMMSVFTEDVFNDLGIEATDEHVREIFIEICYRLIYREMTTLLNMPISERNMMNRILHPKPKKSKRSRRKQ